MNICKGKKQVIKCRNGESCRYNKAGRCSFFHPPCRQIQQPNKTQSLLSNSLLNHQPNQTRPNNEPNNGGTQLDINQGSLCGHVVSVQQTCTVEKLEEITYVKSTTQSPWNNNLWKEKGATTKTICHTKHNRTVPSFGANFRTNVLRGSCVATSILAGIFSRETCLKI